MRKSSSINLDKALREIEMDEKMASGILEVMQELEYLRWALNKCPNISAEDASDSLFAIIRVLENITGIQFYPKGSTPKSNPSKNGFTHDHELPNMTEGSKNYEPSEPEELIISISATAGRNEHLTKKMVMHAIQEYISTLPDKEFWQNLPDNSDSMVPDLNADTESEIAEIVRISFGNSLENES